MDYLLAMRWESPEIVYVGRQRLSKHSFPPGLPDFTTQDQLVYADANEAADFLEFSLRVDLRRRVGPNRRKTFAERIADAILQKWDIVEEVTVTVRKPSAPIRHLVDHVGVSITRARNG